MKLARVRHDRRVHLVRLEQDAAFLLAEESQHPARDVLREALVAGIDLNGSGHPVPLHDVTILAPVINPSKFLGVGMNYADHAREAGLPIPDRPVLFAKTPNSIVGPGEAIVADPDVSTQIDYEVELAIVIGTRTRKADEATAARHILGYTVCNDVSARDAQFSDGQWIRAKSFDTFAPLGPCIITDGLDVSRLRLRTSIGGVLLQDGNTASMIFSPTKLVSYISQAMTLEPGDVITTGTPPGVGFARTPPRFLQPGDRVTVSIEGIGDLTNPVVPSSASTCASH